MTNLASSGIQKNFDTAAWDIIVLIILWLVLQNKMPGIVNNSIRAVFERKGQYYTCMLIGEINILLLLLIIVIRFYCFSWSVGPFYRNRLMFFLNMTWHISPIIACFENRCQDHFISFLALGFCICTGLTFSPLKQLARIFVWKAEDLFIVAFHIGVGGDNCRSLYILHHLAQRLFKLRGQASLSGQLTLAAEDSS